MGSSEKIDLKTPKGTKDYAPAEMAIREKAFSIITQCFKLYGAVTIDTPVFELKEVLTNKYGEDSKLIFDLQDQGGELCSLRYDLTVPFARFLAMNKHIKAIKRYHIGKVYRRDQPIMTRGRFREFYQCDFDIAGQYESMLADAEIIAIMHQVLSRLKIGEFVIKINHRKLLDGIFEACGVPCASFRTICSSVDKLDKVSCSANIQTPWEEVRSEMISEKGLGYEVADHIGSFVSKKGDPCSLLKELASDPILLDNASAQLGIAELQRLFSFINMMVVKEEQQKSRVILDLSLARGLDYYTGMITEAVLFENKHNFVGMPQFTLFFIGSIAGGGRYDGLVQNFSNSGHTIPCVGMSIGIERIFAIMEAQQEVSSIVSKTIPTQVLVASLGDPLLSEHLAICQMLRSANIPTETPLKQRNRPFDIFEYAEKNMVPILVIFGQDEIAAGSVRIKQAYDREDKGKLVPIASLVQEIALKLENTDL